MIAHHTAASTENADGPTTPPGRLTSVDAYRGFVMFLMMAEVLHLAGVAKAHPDVLVWKPLAQVLHLAGVAKADADVSFWKLLAHHQEHVEWVGCTLHDLIQPSFSFLVGVALPFSIASRRARGQSTGRMIGHAFWRAFVLAALGIFLRSRYRSQTNFTFEDTLTQIGLGYGFLFLLGLRPVRDQWIALVVILVGYWAAFALYTPGSDFQPSSVGVPADWPGNASGFAAHWNKNANFAWKADTRLLNLLPRQKPFEYNGGGYSTLSFIPTLGTMILGLIAGGVLKSNRPSGAKVGWFVAAGVVGLASGWALGEFGICPVVKRIWTPSWVLFSGGWCFLLLAAFYTVVDLARLRVLFFPLVVIGMNSIAAYVLSGTLGGFVDSSIKTHRGLLLNTELGRSISSALPAGYDALYQATAVLLVLWLILFWMYRRRIFLRV